MIILGRTVRGVAEWRSRATGPFAPDAPARQLWNLVSLVLFAYQFISIPYRAAFMPLQGLGEQAAALTVCDYLCDAACHVTGRS